MAAGVYPKQGCYYS